MPQPKPSTMVSLGFVTVADGVVPGFPLLTLQLGGAPGPLLHFDGRKVGRESYSLTWTVARDAGRSWFRELAECLDGLGWERWRIACASWEAVGGLNEAALDAFAEGFWPAYRPIGRARVLLDIPDEPGLRDAARAWSERYRHLRFDLDLEELVNPVSAEKKRSILARLGPTISRNLKAFPKRIGQHGHRQVRPGKD